LRVERGREGGRKLKGDWSERGGRKVEALEEEKVKEEGEGRECSGRARVVEDGSKVIAGV